MPRATTKGPAALAAAAPGTITQIACPRCGPAHPLRVGDAPHARDLRCRECGLTRPLPAQMEVALAGGSPLPGLGDDEMPPTTPTTTRDRSARNTDRLQRLMARATADLEQQQPVADAGDSPSMSAGELVLPLAEIAPHALNPRKQFDQAALDELAGSIREHGLLQPIVVRSAGDVPPGVPRWWIVAGERRWRAAQLAGLEQVPARVIEVQDDAHHLRLALLENLARKDLDPVEEARGYEQLRTLGGMTQAEIATSVGRAPSSVANAVRLLGLPADVLRRISAGELTASHGKALLKWAAFPAVVSKLAEESAKLLTPSKDLEMGLRHTKALADAKLAVEVPSTYNAPFDTAICRACPFGAFFKDAGSFGFWCLKPAHMRELKRKAKDEKDAALKVLADGSEVATTAGVPHLIDLTVLPWGKVVDLEMQAAQRPAACKGGACPCLRFGKRGDREGIPVCVEPARFSRLQDEQEAAESAALADLHQRAIVMIEAAVAEHSALGEQRALALLATLIVTSGTYDEADTIREVVRRHAPDVALPRGGDIAWQRLKLDPALFAALSFDALMRLCLEVALRLSARRVFMRHVSGEEPLRWMLPAVLALREGRDPDAAPSYPRRHPEPCGTCGGEVVINSAAEEAALAADVDAGRAEGRVVQVLCDGCGEVAP